MTLTTSQRLALETAIRNGAIVHHSRWGPWTTGTLKALVRRGLLELIPDAQKPAHEYRAWYRPTTAGQQAMRI